MICSVLCMKENFAETMRQLSAAWRNMTQAEKDRYRAAAAQTTKTSKTAGRRARRSGSASATRQRPSTSVRLASSSLHPRHQSTYSSARAGCIGVTDRNKM